MQVWTTARAGEGFFNLGFWNRVSTAGAFLLALVISLFIINVFHTQSRAPSARLDPWDARTLEWITTSPPPPHNFHAIPEVHTLDEFFHRKYADVGTGDRHELRKVATAEQILAEQPVPSASIRLPSPSCWPLVLSLAFPLVGFGVIYHWSLAAVGGVVTVVALFGWALEPAFDDTDITPDAGGVQPKVSAVSTTHGRA